MCFLMRGKSSQRAIFSLLIILTGGNFLTVFGQTQVSVLLKENKQVSDVASDKTDSKTAVEKPLVVSVLPNYYDAQTGASAIDLISRALQANGELVAARLEIEKARARLAQARLRPNPTLEIEQTSGRFLGSPGEGDLSVGATLPLELYGQRRRRIELAEIEITAREADIANRERQLAAEVLTSFAEALAALQALKITENLLELDLETTRFVQIRVNEGETPPLELSLLQVEVERLRANLALSEGKLEAALTRLKLLAGMPFEEPLRLREQVNTVTLSQVPSTIETAIEVALRTRPDIRIAQIEEELAAAGLRPIRKLTFLLTATIVSAVLRTPQSITAI
jgi:cobalt-zinc-cadmium efflux system outer membrane protein